MFELFSKVIDTSGYLPRCYCVQWTDAHGWLHILSEIAIWAAYTTIAIVLVYFVRRRKDVSFSWAFLLFVAFILACGSTYLVEAITFGRPIYQLAGLMKLMTAIISWVMVLALIRIFPSTLNHSFLATTNELLSAEIEQRKEQERSSNALQARYEALLSGTRSILWTTDEHGSFVTPQISWERYTGQTWEKHRDGGWINALHADDRSELMRLWKEALSTGAKYRAQGRLWHQASDSYRPFVAEAVPVIDENGLIVEWVGTVSDIHEQRLAEAALRKAEAESNRQKYELELLYDAAPVGMGLIDREQRYVRVNKSLAEMNGLTREFQLGKTVAEVLPHLQDAIIPLYQQVIQTGEAVLNIEVTGKRASDNQQRWWLVSYYPLMGKDNEVWAVSSIVQDITDRKEYEHALERANQGALQANLAKSQFLANMSHEIRTPMTAILGYADVLLGHLEDPDDRGNVLIIKRNGEHLLDIINDILDLSRIEAGKLQVSLQPHDLPNLIADMHSLMQVRAEEKQLEFHVRCDGPIPETILTDSTRLRQILINLLGNAIKFTEQGTVELVTRVLVDRQNATIEFEVSDTGIGMSLDQQKRLFQPFSQGDSSVNRAFGGSGLGLAISKRLVTMLQGDITFESSPDNGTIFFVRVPCGSLGNVSLVEPKLESESQSNSPGSALRSDLNCRVLVVDDRRDVRHVSQHFLEAAGATVVTAEDGQQAIDTVQQAVNDELPFDLIVMDMQMPNVDGYQATKILRSSGFSCPIIALTANAMKGDRERCLKAGCDDYLAKPIDGKSFVAMVARYSRDNSNSFRGQCQIENHEPNSRSHSHQKRVLVVDDNADTANLLGMILGAEGFDPDIVNCGEVALQRAQQHEFHAVVLDIGLPDIDGHQVAQRLRHEGFLGRLIAVSGHGEEEDIQRSLDVGFDHHLVKPASPEQLLKFLNGNVKT